MLRNSLEYIANNWPAYKSGITVNSKHPVANLVKKELPEFLDDNLIKFGNFKVEGSTGRGNVSAIPWIATFHPRITLAATNGFYPVYLFSTDMSRVILSLALGTTQFGEYYGENKRCLENIAKAATRFLKIHEDKIPAGWKRGPINLESSEFGFRPKSYEQAAIISKSYTLSNLPSENHLMDDYLSLVEVYNAVSESSETPTIEELLEATIIQPLEDLAIPAPSVFTPRIRTKKSNNRSSYSGPRHSKESKKVGDAGEKVVLSVEKNKLKAIGRTDLADKVVWEANEGNKPGWDITSFDKRGHKIRIEVKATKAKTLTQVELTANEWKNAQKYGQSYFIYFVMEALSASPKIEIMRNPAKAISDHNLVLKPSSFRLSLFDGSLQQ